ncbi:hypothetical protein TorRG33x02_233240 [Trema orientale]|uniref:Secreted protein n=1 Tax=Trema orientale TaxID=63057 RepID=A0A2P5E5K5_TREOI|nr:hypothetical protein TorRG33x02_233240 [Trema orientale]
MDTASGPYLFIILYCIIYVELVEARTDVAFADDLGRGVSGEECEDGSVNQQTSSDRRGFARRPWTVAAPARTNDDLRCFTRQRRFWMLLGLREDRVEDEISELWRLRARFLGCGKEGCDREIDKEPETE